MPTYTYDTLPPAEQAALPAVADVIAAITLTGSGTLSVTPPVVHPAVVVPGSGTLSITGDVRSVADENS